MEEVELLCSSFLDYPDDWLGTERNAKAQASSKHRYQFVQLPYRQRSQGSSLYFDGMALKSPCNRKREGRRCRPFAGGRQAAACKIHFVRHVGVHTHTHEYSHTRKHFGTHTVTRKHKYAAKHKEREDQTFNHTHAQTSASSFLPAPVGTLNLNLANNNGPAINARVILCNRATLTSRTPDLQSVKP